MERWSGRVAIVTGESAGIGAALSRRLVNHGMKVVGCARNTDKIQELAVELKDAAGELMPLKCDVTSDDDVACAVKRAREEYGGVDVCVNNAGLAHSQPLLTGDPAAWRDMLDVNVMGVAVMTRHVFQDMRDRGVDDGHIINVNSMSGHRLVGKSSTSFYGVTKHALTAMTEAVRRELREHKSNIRISQVSPGLVYTEFQQRMHGITAEQQAANMEKTPHLTADDVVDAVIYQLSTPPNVQVHDVKIRATEQVS